MTRSPHQQERLRQARGLLLIAAILLAGLLLRAHPVMHLFDTGWWRL